MAWQNTSRQALVTLQLLRQRGQLPALHMASMARRRRHGAPGGGAAAPGNSSADNSGAPGHSAIGAVASSARPRKRPRSPRGGSSSSDGGSSSSSSGDEHPGSPPGASSDRPAAAGPGELFVVCGQVARWAGRSLRRMLFVPLPAVHSLSNRNVVAGGESLSRLLNPVLPVALVKGAD